MTEIVEQQWDDPAPPQRSLRYLSSVIGPLPPMSTPPAAWFMSLNQDVLDGYEQWKVAYKTWADNLTELMGLSGFISENIYIGGIAKDILLGIFPPTPTTDPPRWWRTTKKGYWVPRKRTIAEKNSEVFQRFESLQVIPRETTYLPGLPDSIVVRPKVSFASICRPGQAVLAFYGADPDQVQNFPIGSQWRRMKLSTFWSLKEFQKEESVTDAG